MWNRRELRSGGFRISDGHDRDRQLERQRSWEQARSEVAGLVEQLSGHSTPSRLDVGGRRDRDADLDPFRIGARVLFGPFETVGEAQIDVLRLKLD
jgi:hypothetical protein